MAGVRVVDLEAGGPGSPGTFDVHEPINGDSVKTLDRYQIDQRIVTIESMDAAAHGAAAIQSELAQLNLWQSQITRNAVLIRQTKITNEINTIKAKPALEHTIHEKAKLIALEKEKDRESLLLDKATVSMNESHRKLKAGDIAWAFPSPLTAELEFNPKFRVTEQTVPELTKRQIQERITAINTPASPAVNSAPNIELKQLQLWEKRVTVWQLDEYKKRLDENIRTEADVTKKAELQRRRDILDVEKTNLSEEITSLEKILAGPPPQTAWENVPYSFLAFDPTVAINEDSVLDLTSDGGDGIANIEARLKMLEDIAKPAPGAAAATIGLSKEEKDEKLQLELWKAQIGQKNLAADASEEQKTNAAEKVRLAKEAVASAGLTPWDFSKYRIPAKPNSGSGVSAPSSEENKFNSSEITADAFHYIVGSIMGRMVEALLNALSRINGQMLFDVALGVGSIAFNFVGCTVLTALGVVTRGPVAWIFGYDASNYFLGKAENLSKDYALIYKPLRYLGIRFGFGVFKNDKGLSGKDAANDYLDLGKFGDLAKDGTINHIFQLPILNIVPALGKVIFHSSVMIAHVVPYMTYNFMSSIAKSKERKADYQHAIDNAKNSMLYHKNKALKWQTEGLGGSANDTRETVYNFLAKTSNWYATSHNLVRWERRARELHPNVPINVSPRRPGYFGERRKKFDAIYEEIEQMLKDALPPGSNLYKELTEAKAKIEKCDAEVNSPVLEPLDDFLSNLKKQPGETSDNHATRIKEECDILVRELAKSKYFNEKQDKIDKIHTTLKDKGFNLHAIAKLTSMASSPSIKALEELNTKINRAANSNDADQLVQEFLKQNPDPKPTITAYILLGLLSPILVPAVALFMIAHRLGSWKGEPKGAAAGGPPVAGAGGPPVAGRPAPGAAPEPPKTIKITREHIRPSLIEQIKSVFARFTPFGRSREELSDAPSLPGRRRARSMTFLWGIAQKLGFASKPAEKDTPDRPGPGPDI